MDKTKVKIQIGIISIVVIAIVVLAVFMVKQNKVIADLESQRDNIKEVKQENFDKSINQSEVKEYEAKTKGKLNDFLDHKYKDDSLNEEGSAYKAMRGLFTVQSHKIILDKNAKHEDYLKYYSPFDYEIKNFSAEKDGNDVKVLFNIDTTYHDKPINESYDLMALTFGEDGKLKGGSLYAK